ncbi:ureidoglycolate lyase [Mesobacterium pallidum]|uniref:ureidoglycolate lyase n=1 Tax=Mesobacterium pallidum TaxID=2872037 RepID=UPI001EE1BFD3|nr:ureidoglycolate lyase [Mesobacterium pallidum]
MPPSAPLVVQARPLTAEDFAPYGSVARPGAGAVKAIRDGQVRLSKSPAGFEHAAGAPRLALDFYEVAATAPRLSAQQVERHPLSTQMFSPMRATRWLVAVWPDGPDGQVEAFVAGPEEVVTYDPGVWHHGVVALDSTATFTSLMFKTPDGQGDTEFAALPAPVLIDWPAA